MNRFSIKDIENLTGIKAHTLRIWEQRHGIIMPKRTDTNIRYYDGDDLKQALRVALLNQHGYKISRIRKMNDAEIDKLLSEEGNTQLKFEYLVNSLLEATVDMDTDKFKALLNDYISSNGIEDTVEKLLFSFLEKVGIMWMTNRIFPAQEHLVSNIIARKLLLAIEQIDRPVDASKPTFLLFLPEGEIHEIGLLYMHYQLLKHNYNVVYLGANTPSDQVPLVASKLSPDYLYTHITSTSNDFDINKYLDTLSQVEPAKKVFVSGYMLMAGEVKNCPPKITILSSLGQAKDTIATTI